MRLIFPAVAFTLAGCRAPKEVSPSPASICAVHHRVMHLEKVQIVADLPNGETVAEHEYEKKAFPHHGGVIYFPKLSFKASAEVCDECNAGYLHWLEIRRKKPDSRSEPSAASREGGGKK